MITKVSALHEKAPRWRREFAALRTICLASGLEETVKWGQACYTLAGRNVALIHGFRDYCAVLFMKGALLSDPKGVLIQQTPNVQSARQMRFRSLAEVRMRRATLKAYLVEATAVERSGAKVPRKSVAGYAAPAEWTARLRTDRELAAAFQALTPGRQKAYLLYFSAAKRSATRTARIDQHSARIRRGLGLRD